jgi:hypothetical protein
MSIASNWAARFGDLLPLGHVLRTALAGSRWLRIHSLPEAKRYAESGAEYDELLRRHNEVASEVLGSAAPCAMIVARYASGAQTTDWSEEARVLGWSLEPNTTWGRAAYDDDGVFLEFAIAPVAWSPSTFDALIRSVADDQERGVLFFSETTGEVYAPYDGGADLFLRSSDRRDAFRLRWQRWLSARLDGL